MSETLDILLVEDDEDDFVLTRELLSEAFGSSYKLDWVTTWDAALETLLGDKYDVCLVDYQLGKRTGLELIKTIHEGTNRGVDVPFIMLTGQDSREIDLEASRVGATDYLVKGQNTAPLLERTIRYALARQEHLKAEQESKDLLKKANHRLSELYNTAHQFADNVSHEFRTPLAVIKEFTSIIADGLAGEVSDEQQEYLGIVINRVDDLAVMVDDMLDISKLEAGLLRVVRQENRIEDIVGAVRPTLERKAAANGATLSIEIDSSLPTVYCDAEKIGRVIINLAVNALKFSGEGGKVSLWARHDHGNSEIIVGVADDGPGIALEHVQAIFDRFKQVGGDIRASTKGFGLGLNIAKELVNINLGDIAVESEVGKGSTFTFTIPEFDPPKILERFIECIEQFRNGSSYVSLIAARTEPMANGVAEGVPDDNIEQFLQGQLRRSDLLFRAASGRWLLVVATNQQHLNAMLARLGNAWKDINRNRPGPPLPAIDFEINGTWRVSDGGTEFIKRFNKEFDFGSACRGERSPRETVGDAA